MKCGCTKSINHVTRHSLKGVLKFNVDGEARGKSGPSGIGRVLRNSKGVGVDLLFQAD